MGQLLVENSLNTIGATPASYHMVRLCEQGEQLPLLVSIVRITEVYLLLAAVPCAYYTIVPHVRLKQDRKFPKAVVGRRSGTSTMCNAAGDWSTDLCWPMRSWETALDRLLWLCGYITPRAGDIRSFGLQLPCREEQEGEDSRTYPTYF